MLYDAVDVFTYLLMKSTGIQMVYKLYLTMILSQYRRGMLNRIVRNMCDGMPLSGTLFVIHERRFKPLKFNIPFEAAERYKVRIFEGDYGIYVLKPKEELRPSVFEQLMSRIPPQVRVVLDNIAEKCCDLTISETELGVLNVFGLKCAQLWKCGGKIVEECLSQLGYTVAEVNLCAEH